MPYRFFRRLRPIFGTFLALILATVSHAQMGSGGLKMFGLTALNEPFPSRAPVKQVAVCLDSIAVLREDGTLMMWGVNSLGQCNVPRELDHVKKIVLGPYGFDRGYSLALKDDGTLVAWGGMTVPNLTNVVDIAGGYSHALALLSDGTVAAWGSTRDGECAVPAGLNRVVKIAVGERQSYAIKDDGTLVSWGAAFAGQPVAKFRDIAVGYDRCVGLLKDTSVVQWGPRRYGDWYVNFPSGLKKVVAVTAAGYHGGALTENGDVYMWGGDRYPANADNVVSFATGYNTTVFVHADGSVTAGGGSPALPFFPRFGPGPVRNFSFRFGRLTATRFDGDVAMWGTESVPSGLGDVVQLANGGAHSLALRSDGTVAAWGQNDQGQCNVPAGLSGVVAVAAGQSHSLALRSDGTCIGWGANGAGQATPPAGIANYVGISAGPNASFGVRRPKTMAIWGDLPPPASPLTGVVDIQSSTNIAMALKADGSVVSWGGWGSPATPTGLPPLTAISVAQTHGVGIKADGSLVGWAYDDRFWRFSEDYATVRGTSRVATGYGLTLIQPELGLDLSTFLCRPGASIKGTVTITSPAPEGGKTVSLSCDAADVGMSSSVVIRKGARSATFLITTDPARTTTEDVKVSADDGLSGSKMYFRVGRPVVAALQSIELSESSVVGGSTVDVLGRINLTDRAPLGGLVVKLKSSSASLTVPDEVTVPYGGNTVTFPVTHTQVHTATSATVTARMGAVTCTATLSVQPFQLNGELLIRDPTIHGGERTYAWLRINAAPRDPVTVNISGSSSDIADFPTTATFDPGQQLRTLWLDAHLTTTDRVLNLTAELNGVTSTKSLTVLASVMASFSINPSDIYGTQSTTGRITLTNPAPSGGLTVNLAADKTGFTMPTSVLIPEGSSEGTFTIAMPDLLRPLQVTVTANVGTQKATTPVTARVMGLDSLTVNPRKFVGGSATVVTGAAYLAGVAGSDIEVTLTSSDPHVTVPATLMIPAGSQSASFNITHTGVTTTTTVSITLKRRSASRTVTLTVLEP